MSASAVHWQSHALGLIDLRERDAFEAGHPAGATHINRCTLHQRLHELPPRGVRLSLYALPGDQPVVLEIREFLETKGYHVVDCFWHDADTQQALMTNGGWSTGKDSAVLWTPCRYLADWTDEIETHTPGRSAIDVGCGGGRDAVYLARRGWDVLGIDYDERATSKASALGEHYAGPIRTQIMNLEVEADPFGDICADLVVVCRYLHRPLFPALQRIVKPGGCVFYHTFMVGAEAFGKPRSPHHLLKPGELQGQFEGWDVFHDEIYALQDGRPVAAFLARKPV